MANYIHCVTSLIRNVVREWDEGTKNRQKFSHIHGSMKKKIGLKSRKRGIKEDPKEKQNDDEVGEGRVRGGVNQRERKRGAREGKIRERSGKERGKGNRELDSFSRFFDPRHVHFIRANLRFTKIGLPHTTFSLSESRTIHRLTDSSSFASPMRRN